MFGKSTPGILLAFIAAMHAGCGQDPPAGIPANVSAVQVLVEPLQYHSIQTRVEAVGTSRAIRSIELHPATSGEVAAVKFEPGQRAAGDAGLNRGRRKAAVAHAE
jgi:hypothetical protein